MSLAGVESTMIMPSKTSHALLSKTDLKAHEFFFLGSTCTSAIPLLGFNPSKVFPALKAKDFDYAVVVVGDNSMRYRLQLHLSHLVQTK